MYPILDTRVECKVGYSGKTVNKSWIRIEPDWNVKRVIVIIGIVIFSLE